MQSIGRWTSWRASASAWRTRAISASGPDRAWPASARMWDAYDRVCTRLGRGRTEDLLDHIRRQITEHGDEDDRAALAEADAELAARRARKGGRPRKNPG